MASCIFTSSFLWESCCCCTTYLWWKCRIWVRFIWISFSLSFSFSPPFFFFHSPAFFSSFGQKQKMMSEHTRRQNSTRRHSDRRNERARRPTLPPTPPSSFRQSFSSIDSSQEQSSMLEEEVPTSISWPIALAVIPTLGAFFAGSAEIWSDFVISLLILYYVYKWMTGKYTLHMIATEQAILNFFLTDICSSLVPVRGSTFTTHNSSKCHSQQTFVNKAIGCRRRATPPWTSWTVLGHCVALHRCLHAAV